VENPLPFFVSFLQVLLAFRHETCKMESDITVSYVLFQQLSFPPTPAKALKGVAIA